MDNTLCRDRFWIWGQDAKNYFAGKNFWKLPGVSRMTPAEGAFYLDIPNAFIVRFGNVPEPRDFRQFAMSLAPLKRVVWSIVGDSSSRDNDHTPDIEPVLRLAAEFPNISGAVMDDFFKSKPQPGCRYTADEVADFREQLRRGPRPLELSVVLYAHELELPVREHLANVDTVTFWTWYERDLAQLETNLGKVEQLAPRQNKLLGIYLWDFGGSKPLSLEAMEYQCQLGLKWLRAGRVDGLIFLCNWLLDLDLETVAYTRRFIAENGVKPLRS